MPPRAASPRGSPTPSRWITTAYAILRHNGVDVGKMDFLGPLNFVEESS